MYKNCFSVILPTRGNSSLPLLEAFYFHCKIIYHSEILDDEFRDKVISINIKDPSDLTRVLKRMQENEKYYVIL